MICTESQQNTQVPAARNRDLLPYFVFCYFVSAGPLLIRNPLMRAQRAWFFPLVLILLIFFEGNRVR